MKSRILTSLMATIVFTSAFANEKPTKTENDAAMKSGHAFLVAKAAELKMDVKAQDRKATEAAAADVLVLMRKGMQQINTNLDLTATDEQKRANAKHYQATEDLIMQFRLISSNALANGEQLVNLVNSFLKEY